MMQAARFLALPSPRTPRRPGPSLSASTCASKLRHRGFDLVKAGAVTYDMVDYSSPASVFPAEACETIGGKACEVEMFPEAKLGSRTGSSGAPKSSGSMDAVDREYYEDNSPKTVFPGDACDDLGGEFCEAEYQRGVY